MQDVIKTQQKLTESVDFLCDFDADLKLIRDACGYPPLWQREESFGTLVQIILEQQVSLDSARAAYGKLERRLGVVEPVAFLKLSDEVLRECGFSRQKTRYARCLAEAIEGKCLLLLTFSEMSDEEVLEKLTSITGIGQWSADIYRLMAMGRADIWPLGDIALAQALMDVYGLEKRPSNDEQLEMVEKWRPFRAVAARLLWMKYLKERGREAAEF